eukprot:TRINITY_DN2306_c0_g1_i9.p1 TRINITY_DN2306_c0_g1~~TRINITY_DN2306_c0_g1_i9.p1  ORF type:complete len:235 (+),score=63.57 TRINITY_DN2306_c0_g1_i9:142-846(+)
MKFVLACLVIVLAFASCLDDYDVIDFPSKGSETKKFHYLDVKGHYSSTGREYRGYLAIINSPDHLHFYPPEGGCDKKVKTSETANYEHCDYATNAGFFIVQKSFQGDRCIGSLISNNTVVQMNGNNHATFATTKDGRYVIGHIKNDVDKFKYVDLIEGNGYLIRKGESNIHKMVDVKYDAHFTTEKAPRTAVGILKSGKPFLFQVDGVEITKAGPDLMEFTELMMELGNVCNQS